LPGPEPTKPGVPPKLPVEAWSRIARALKESPEAEDRELGRAVGDLINRMPAVIEFVRALPPEWKRQRVGTERTRQVAEPTRQVVERARPGPEMER
jgi:hypothetical protein